MLKIFWLTSRNFSFKNSTFDDKQWYEGQTVKCTFGGLQKARWLSDPKAPPESFHRRISAESNANNKAKFIIEKVKKMHKIDLLLNFDPFSLFLG